MSTLAEFRTTDIGDSVEPGTKVEVRSRFERSWARGFEIAEVVAHAVDGGVVERSESDEQRLVHRSRQGLDEGVER